MASTTVSAPAPPTAVDRTARILFTATILVSSFLLFLIQPMYARMMLPKVGGAPIVWNAALVFFQGVLLVGYYYAHVFSRKLGPIKHSRWHWVVLLLPIPFLPLMLRPLPGVVATSQPVLWLLGTLVLGVGVPYAVVATTSPLVQRWFATTSDPMAQDPYFLYAASNIGSFAALLVYPFWMEPNVTLIDQGRIWGALYVLMALLVGLCGRRVGTGHESLDDTPSEPLAVREVLIWGLLAFVPSSLMVATTTFITTSIVSAPMIWVLPLGLYLLTFVLAFAKRQPIPDWLLSIVAAAGIVINIATNYSGYATDGRTKFIVNIITFFVVAWLVHRRLASRRPSHEHLTGFYFAMSVGGVLGGMFAALLAPLVFTRVLEYPISFALAAIAVFPLLKGRSWWDLAYGLVAVGLYFGAAAIANAQPHLGFAQKCMVIWLPLSIFVFLGVVRPIRFFVSAAVMAVVGMIYDNQNNVATFEHRSYFGTLTVHNDTTRQRRALIHGTILHGVQSLNPELRQKPSSYYCEEGPIGDMMSLIPRPADAHFAVVGCGVGTMTAYGKKGEHWTIFEIDPEVRSVATADPIFSYISRSPAQVDFAMGDARIQLSQSTDRFDLIVLDAYSSDNIPLHLMTVEAFETYAARLTEHGVLAVHISNRFLDLKQQVALISNRLGLAHLHKFKVFPSDDPELRSSSEWMAVAKSPQDVAGLNGLKGWTVVVPKPGVKVWTDERSSILDVLVPNWIQNIH